MDRLPALSDRARAFLRSAGARRVPGAHPSVALAAAAAQGLPASPALEAFEESFGGLTFAWGRRRVVLGVATGLIDDGDLSMAHDDDRVFIGREDEWTDLSMSPDGRLWSHGPDGAPWPLAGSAVRYVEHLALHAGIESWCPDPLRVALPPRATEMAGVLGLTSDEVASDDHLAAWEGDRYRLLQRIRGNPYAVGCADLLCPDLDAAAWALLCLRRAFPGLRISVVGPDGRTERSVWRQGWARVGDQVPDPESWADEGNAVRFDYLGDGLGYLGRPDAPGVVWLLGGPGTWRIEQVVLAGLPPTEGVARWDSHDAARCVSRLFLPIEPMIATR